MVMLTDCPDMTIDVYRGRKTTIQQQHNKCLRRGGVGGGGKKTLDL